MKSILVITATLLAVTASAQRHKLGEINTETEAGKFLQAIGTEEDAARKVQLMEAFVAKFGTHEALGWVWSQLQPAYVKAGSFDKALAAGEKLLAADAMDLDAAYSNLKASEGKKDSSGIAKWAVVTSDIARKTAAAPKAADEEEDDHKRAVDYAKQVEQYTEYALYAAVLTEQNPQTVVTLAETLEARNPNGQYVPQMLGKYTWAAREAKVMPQAVALGERALARGQMNEDLLLAMADYESNLPKKDADKIILYSTKLVELMGSKPKPEGVADADWEKKKNTMIGVGHWMAGTAYVGQSKFAQGDKSLRAALPLIGDNEQLKAGALFHLGLANYQMGKGKSAQMMAEAMKFMQQCAAIKSVFQGQAQKNMAVMKKEMGGK